MIEFLITVYIWTHFCIPQAADFKEIEPESLRNNVYPRNSKLLKRQFRHLQQTTLRNTYISQKIQDFIRRRENWQRTWKVIRLRNRIYYRCHKTDNKKFKLWYAIKSKHFVALAQRGVGLFSSLFMSKIITKLSEFFFVSGVFNSLIESDYVINITALNYFICNGLAFFSTQEKFSV